jgi:alpha-galactosidase
MKTRGWVPLVLGGSSLVGAMVALVLDGGPALAQSGKETQAAAPRIKFDVARTPPMGWNGWNCFQKGNADEVKIKQIADAMVGTGMKDAGYSYVIVDDNWMLDHRDADGNLIVDTAPGKFPGGMKALGDYVHGKGLKFGMYLCYGPKTCLGLPGSEGHEQQDVDLLASFGVDFLKVDLCPFPKGSLNEKEKLFTRCINNTGRPILYYVDGLGIGNEFPSVPPGDRYEYLWAAPYAHLIRIAWDSVASFDGPADWGGTGVLQTMDIMASIVDHSGPGHWLDADMLQVGNGMTPDEDRTEFAFWSIVNSSLIAGNDIRNMSPTTREILLNAEIIAVNQDTAGIAHRVLTDGYHEIWSKPLKQSGSRAVLLVNRKTTAANMTVPWSVVGLSGSATVRDLYAKADRGAFTDGYTVNVPGHGCAMLKVVGRP